MSAYQPTLRDRLATAALRMTGDNEFGRYLVERAIGSTGLGQRRMGAIDALPLGLPLQADEAGRRIAMPGHRIGGAVDLALAAVPIPGAAKKAMRGGVDDIVKQAASKGVKL